ncbi:MAG: hypothetical protein HY814_13890 [Candidatus Riflebacteria bacterium]|nr:hypothetical protein [Candidatus Riflebacteria bacterium]
MSVLHLIGFVVFAAGVQLAFQWPVPVPSSGLPVPWAVADPRVRRRVERFAGYLAALFSIVFFLPTTAETILVLALPAAAVCGWLAVWYAERESRPKLSPGPEAVASQPRRSRRL